MHSDPPCGVSATDSEKSEQFWLQGLPNEADYPVMEDFSTKELATDVLDSPCTKNAKRLWHPPRIQVLNIDATAGGPSPDATEDGTFHYAS